MPMAALDSSSCSKQSTMAVVGRPCGPQRPLPPLLVVCSTNMGPLEDRACSCGYLGFSYGSVFRCNGVPGFLLSMQLPPSPPKMTVVCVGTPTAQASRHHGRCTGPQPNRDDAAPRFKPLAGHGKRVVGDLRDNIRRSVSTVAPALTAAVRCHGQACCSLHAATGWLHPWVLWGCITVPPWSNIIPMVRQLGQCDVVDSS